MLHWTDYLSALTVPMIAAFGVYIGWMQWRTNSGSLKEKLFDRRMESFNKLQAFLSRVADKGRVDEEDFAAFDTAHQEARFLFDKAQQEYFRKVRRSAINAMMHDSLMSDPSEDRVEQNRLQLKEIAWLVEQLGVIFDRFEPYLGLRHR